MNTIPQPSVKALILSCILSTLLAIIILLVAVLPAEFNIDPTGLGETMGLTVLSQTADTAAKPTVISCADPSLENKDPIDNQIQTPQWQDTVIITVPAKKGLEYKFHIAKGETLEFVWKSQAGEKLYFDFHGEP
ncbi:MAG: hypothetical protein KAR12_18490, partial [Methylococcales bacterium]|nr:hypothetical protein [Methylococcales bacterium]